MDRIENGVFRTYGWSSETHKSFLMDYGLWEEKDGINVLKHILTHLYCTKYNEINRRHSSI